MTLRQIEQNGAMLAYIARERAALELEARRDFESPAMPYTGEMLGEMLRGGIE